MHHAAYRSWSPEETYDVVTAFEAAGIDVARSGRREGTEFWYFDAADALDGLLFETAVRADDGPSE